MKGKGKAPANEPEDDEEDDEDDGEDFAEACSMPAVLLAPSLAVWAPRTQCMSHLGLQL